MSQDINTSIGGGSNELRIITHLLDDDGLYPNNARLPLMVYAGAFNGPEAHDPEVYEDLFHSRAWPPAWRYTVYDFHHYHSTAHEALGCFQGEARIQFGGPNGPVVDVTVGDAVVIPAGVAHKNLGSSGGFTMVGAYPSGQIPDMNYGKAAERPGSDRNISQVSMPRMDPITGASGGLMKEWHSWH